jgi:hypothetical protein
MSPTTGLQNQSYQMTTDPFSPTLYGSTVGTSSSPATPLVPSATDARRHKQAIEARSRSKGKDAVERLQTIVRSVPMDVQQRALANLPGSVRPKEASNKDKRNIQTLTKGPERTKANLMAYSGCIIM